jgi:hypothetical protein
MAIHSIELWLKGLAAATGEPSGTSEDSPPTPVQ